MFYVVQLTVIYHIYQNEGISCKWLAAIAKPVLYIYILLCTQCMAQHRFSTMGPFMWLLTPCIVNIKLKVFRYRIDLIVRCSLHVWLKNIQKRWIWGSMNIKTYHWKLLNGEVLKSFIRVMNKYDQWTVNFLLANVLFVSPPLIAFIFFAITLLPENQFQLLMIILIAHLAHRHIPAWVFSWS